MKAVSWKTTKGEQEFSEFLFSRTGTDALKEQQMLGAYQEGQELPHFFQLKVTSPLSISINIRGTGGINSPVHLKMIISSDLNILSA